VIWSETPSWGVGEREFCVTVCLREMFGVVTSAERAS